MNRREVLEAAIKCVCHDRQDQHGNAIRFLSAKDIRYSAHGASFTSLSGP